MLLLSGVNISQHDCHYGGFWGTELWYVPPLPADQAVCNSQPASSDNHEPNIGCHRPRSGRYLIPGGVSFFQYRCGPKLRNDHTSTEQQTPPEGRLRPIIRVDHSPLSLFSDN